MEELNPIAFLSGAFQDEHIRLAGASGRESLGSNFELELFLVRDGEPFTPEQLDALLSAPCAVALGADAGDLVHGILRRVQSLDTSAADAPRYVATMVPTTYLLTLARSNRIFQDLSVPAIVQSILEQYGLRAGEDFRMQVGSYAPREYVVQYEETDWDFIQRWLESEGLYYWFEHRGAHECLIIADSNSAASPIAAPDSISYRQRNNLGAGVSTIWDWTMSQQRVPARVAVFDYNYRSPAVRLVGRATVDATYGFGSVMYYNEHFKSNDEGADVARVRAERLLCERRVFTGTSDCARLRVGHVFDLTNHYDAATDGQYLVTALAYRVGAVAPAGIKSAAERGSAPSFARAAEDAAADVFHRYEATFEAVPVDVQYRPARVTPWPSIQGVIHGHIESDGSGKYAQIDDKGRYKVRFPFDAGNAPGTLASRWVRMAQPYSGAGYGSHHPLHKGAEVLLAHVDGDPDRPIVIGSVPHEQTASPVTAANATQSVVHTPSGLRIELEDLQE